MAEKKPKIRVSKGFNKTDPPLIYIEKTTVSSTPRIYKDREGNFREILPNQFVAEDNNKRETESRVIQKVGVPFPDDSMVENHPKRFRIK